MSDSRFGLVGDSRGNPLPNALVQVTVADADGQPTPGEGTVLAGVTNDQGMWIVDLGRVRTRDGSAPFVYGLSDHLRSVVDAGNAGMALTTVPVSTTPPLVQEVQPVATQRFSFGPGWNTIALSVRPVAKGSLGDLTRRLNAGDRPGRLVRAYRYADGTWDGAIISGTTVFGPDFPLDSGQGYFLAMAGRGTWDLDGFAVAEPPTRTLQRGWNLIGVPGPASRLRASDLVASAGRQSATGAYRVAEVARWASGGYEMHVAGFSFNDFLIEPNQAYFVRATETFQWSAPVAGSLAHVR